MSKQIAFDLAKWKREIRDPANQSTEGQRWIHAPGHFTKAMLLYEIAPLPSGDWAWKAELTIQDLCHRTPWTKAPASRAAALHNMLLWATGILTSEIKNPHSSRDEHTVPAAKALLERLDDTGLFGFIEPDPER